jgi:nucleotide-binding universal stress UspA family protein
MTLENAMQKILVATDGTRGANRAVIAAAQLAKSTEAELFIMTVGGNIPASQLKRLARVENDIGEALELLSNQILDHAQRRAKRIGAPLIKLRTAWGDAAETIITTARRDEVDIIVVGRRGRSRLTGLLLGSVSQKIASLAPCIAMIVP